MDVLLGWTYLIFPSLRNLLRNVPSYLVGRPSYSCKFNSVLFHILLRLIFELIIGSFFLGCGFYLSGISVRRGVLGNQLLHSRLVNLGCGVVLATSALRVVPKRKANEVLEATSERPKRGCVRQTLPTPTRIP